MLLQDATMAARVLNVKRPIRSDALTVRACCGAVDATYASYRHAALRRPDIQALN